MSVDFISRPVGTGPDAPEVVDLRQEGLGAMDTFSDEAPADGAGAEALSETTGSELTYERYFGLREKPFSLSTDPRFLYRSDAHTPVLCDLTSAIRRREGLIVLTGDIGTGKTTLCRAVLTQLDRKTFATFVTDPFGTREDLLKTMLVEFGVMSVDDLVKGRLKGASRPDLSYPLYEFLRSLRPLDAFAVLVVDEVQNLSLPLLEEVRILADLEEGGRKLLQVVLVGQPEFEEQLRLPRLRQVRQRVAAHSRLEPLPVDDTGGYVAHRLFTAGVTSTQVRFTDEALQLAHRATRGVPRALNLVCDRALAVGEAAQTSRIDADCVRAAVTQLPWAALERLDDDPRRTVIGDDVPTIVAPADLREPSVLPARELLAPPPGAPLVPTPVPASRESVAQPEPAAAVPAQLSAPREAPVDAPSAAPASAHTPTQPTRLGGHDTGAIDADVLALLDLAPTRVTALPNVSRPRDQRASDRPTPAPRRWPSPLQRPASVTALVGLGVLTGVSMVTYWLWARPLLTSGQALPAVAQPAAVVSSLGPLNLGGRLSPSVAQRRPPIAHVAPLADDSTGLSAPAPRAAAPPVTASSAGATDATWAVQAGAFADPARASALQATLGALGFTSFERAVDTPTGTALTGVFVGPFTDRSSALDALARVRAQPGHEQAVVRRVPSGRAAN